MLLCLLRADVLLATLMSVVIALAPFSLYNLCWFQVWLMLLAGGTFFATATCDCVGVQWGLSSCEPWHTLEIYSYYANLLSMGIALTSRLVFCRRQFQTVTVNMVLLTVLFTRFVDGNTGVTVLAVGIFALAAVAGWFAVLFMQGSAFRRKGLVINVTAFMSPVIIFAVAALRWLDAGEYTITILTALEVTATMAMLSLLCVVAAITAHMFPRDM